jgi:CspA family cold shock protein
VSKKELQDKILDCSNCGISFVWSYEEQKIARGEGDGVKSTPHLCPGCRHMLPTSGRERGEVKWYNMRKHYGFIVRSRQPEIFFHRNRVVGKRRLRPGDLVEFAVEEGERGSGAVDVELVARGE